MYNNPKKHNITRVKTFSNFGYHDILSFLFILFLHIISNPSSQQIIAAITDQAFAELDRKTAAVLLLKKGRN